MQDTPSSKTGTSWLACADGAFSDVWVVCERDDARLLKQLFRALLRHPVIDAAIRGGHGDSADAHEARADDLLRNSYAGVAGNWDALQTSLRQIGAEFVESDRQYQDLHELASIVRAHVIPKLLEQYGSEPGRLVAAIAALQQAVDTGLLTVADQQLRTRDALMYSQRQLAEHALQSSERRFATLFDSGMIGILICDLVGNIQEANPAFLQMVGYSRQEVVSGAVRWADMTPAEWRHLDDAAVEQLKAHGVTRAWEKEYIRKDGSRVPILVGVAMLGRSDCIAFVLDISERRQFEELRVRSAELEAQNLRVQESSRLKNEFLANMSHELRTPLNSIIGFADLLCDGDVAPDSPKAREFLASILKSGRHLLQLINDVLDLAKVESGKLEFHPEPVDLSQLVAEVRAVLRSIAASKQIRIETDIDPSANDVSIDPARMKQVLYNYASNALKFTPEGGRVILRVRPEGLASFRLEVEDTGIGIAATDIPRLFVEFQQLDAGAAKKHAGTGLGLALTKRIVEEQGGSVGVKSTPNVGSVFFATLPRLALAHAPLCAPEPTAILNEGATAVLVVEDDARDRSLLVHILSKAGYSVVAAATGSQAIAACAKQTFDAITLDLLLPDLTGLDVLHRVRTEGKNQSTPIVIVSVVAERGIMGGFSIHDFLQKPVNGSELLRSLQRARVQARAGGHILVVDDNADALQVMETTLVQLGYKVQCLPDGERALALIESEPPAAIILDLLMPGMDGFEFLTRFRQRPENRPIPVIIWTNKDLTSQDHKRLHNLAQAVVLKGQMQQQSLTDEIRRVLQRATAVEVTDASV
jgi:PAS domain S-box-containing protein